MASELPLGGSVVQRLQRYGTYGHLKQVSRDLHPGDARRQWGCEAPVCVHPTAKTCVPKAQNRSILPTSGEPSLRPAHLGCESCILRTQMHP